MTSVETGHSAAVAAEASHEGAHTTAHDEAHEHPSDATYIVIALVLAVLTAIEVATYFFEEDLERGALLGILMPLMVAKFWLVAAFFMHLKFDTRLFTRMFVAGLAFAVGVYVVMLATFHFWV